MKELKMEKLGRVVYSLGMLGRTGRFTAKIREALMNEPDWTRVRMKMEGFVRERKESKIRGNEFFQRNAKWAGVKLPKK